MVRKKASCCKFLTSPGQGLVDPCRSPRRPVNHPAFFEPHALNVQQFWIWTPERRCCPLEIRPRSAQRLCPRNLCLEELSIWQPGRRKPAKRRALEWRKVWGLINLGDWAILMWLVCWATCFAVWAALAGCNGARWLTLVRMPDRTPLKSEQSSWAELLAWAEASFSACLLPFLNGENNGSCWKGPRSVFVDSRHVRDFKPQVYNLCQILDWAQTPNYRAGQL